MMHEQSCCFAHKTNCFLKLSLWSSSWLLKPPVILSYPDLIQHSSKSPYLTETINGAEIIYTQVKQRDQKTKGSQVLVLLPQTACNTGHLVPK